jgi:hypothetical protein
VFPKGHSSIPTAKLTAKNGFGNGLLVRPYSEFV